MDTVKEFINRFCVSVTGSLIGMIISVSIQITSPIGYMRIIDLWGLLGANLLIILVSQIMDQKETTSKREGKIKQFVHYLCTLGILSFIAHKLEWIKLDEFKNVLIFSGVIFIIHTAVSGILYWNVYKTSKDINHALSRYQQRQIK